jgi:hypothetical protein
MTTRTVLRGDEYPVTDTMRSRAFWLLRRWSSLAYLDRMQKMYVVFLTAYEDYARTGPPELTEWHHENMALFFSAASDLSRGLDLIKRGKAVGYRHFAIGLRFADDLDSRRYGDFGYRERFKDAFPLITICDQLVRMAVRIGFTLIDGWGWPQILDPFFGPLIFPSRLETLPVPSHMEILYKESVPVSGIWLPVSIVNPCPAYLYAGREAPRAKRVSDRVDYPSINGQPPRTAYFCNAEPSRWRLLWEDRRYLHGARPDESEYLDSTTEIPGNPITGPEPEGART